MEPISFTGFEWDAGNRAKCGKHGVSPAEIEYVLAHAETLIAQDRTHLVGEPRLVAVGRTEQGRYTFVVFTPRRRGSDLLLRPISARYMHRREVERYAQEIVRSQKR